MIYEGEVEIYLKIEREEEGGELILLDELKAGCTIGSYSMLMNEKYNFIAKAKTNVTLMTLNAQNLEEARNMLEDLEIAIFEG